MPARRARFADVVLDKYGNCIVNASVEVRQFNVSTKITETIYADATGAGTLSNPLTTSSLGYFEFYLDQPKRVDLYVSKSGFTAFTMEDVDVQRASASPSLSVAASDASEHAKESADYVCDGTADDIEIQATIDALPT